MKMMPNHVIDRSELIDVLRRWQEGKIGPRSVQEFAEQFTFDNDLEELPRSDDQSIAIEVLLHLDALPMALLTAEDVPVLLRFLATPNGHAIDGWEQWTRYWADFDYEERRRKLAGDTFYVV